MLARSFFSGSRTKVRTLVRDQIGFDHVIDACAGVFATRGDDLIPHLRQLAGHRRASGDGNAVEHSFEIVVHAVGYRHVTVCGGHQGSASDAQCHARHISRCRGRQAERCNQGQSFHFRPFLNSRPHPIGCGGEHKSSPGPVSLCICTGTWPQRDVEPHVAAAFFRGLA